MAESVLWSLTDLRDQTGSAAEAAPIRAMRVEYFIIKIFIITKWQKLNK
jgi:hypothetical protein